VRVDIKGIDQRILALGVPASDYASLAAAVRVLPGNAARGGQAPLPAPLPDARRRAAPFLEGIRRIAVGRWQKRSSRGRQPLGVVVTDRPAKVGEAHRCYRPRCVDRSACRVGDLPERSVFSASFLRRHDARRQLAGGRDKPPAHAVRRASRRPQLPDGDGRRRALSPGTRISRAQAISRTPIGVITLGADYAIENGRYRIRKITAAKLEPGLQAPLQRARRADRRATTTCSKSTAALASTSIYEFFQAPPDARP
jgi:hypothetical protein